MHEDSGDYKVTTSNLTMEIDAVTHAVQWLASQTDAQITRAVAFTDSRSLPQRVESGLGCPTGTQPHTVFGCKDCCGSAALGTPESVGMNGQIRSQNSYP